jgi:hypothetical protein
MNFPVNMRECFRLTDYGPLCTVNGQSDFIHSLYLGAYLSEVRAYFLFLTLPLGQREFVSHLDFQ